VEQRILVDGSTGQTVVSGVNTPVHAILDRLAQDGCLDAVLAAFPGLTHQGVSAALRHGAHLARREAASVSAYGVHPARHASHPLGAPAGYGGGGM
jgi:uncharacterized protein (DUF433 family)